MTAPRVPIIDLDPFFHDGEKGLAFVAEEVRKACEDTGFLVVKNHGMSEDLQKRVIASSIDFFDRPVEEKLKCSDPVSPLLGFNRIGTQRLAYSRGEDSAPDLVETFSLGESNVDLTDPYYSSPAGRAAFPPNIWPPKPARLKNDLEEYFIAATRLSSSMLEIFATALHMPRYYFSTKIDKSMSLLRVNNYPRVSTPPLEGQSRVGAHTDYGMLTIVLPTMPGLQVERENHWEDVPFMPGSLQINIGDLMSQWTNDRWKSTMHKVPPGSVTTERRMSVAFFMQGNYDTLVEPLPTCIDAEHPRKYEPITAGDHLFSKINRQFSISDKIEKVL